MESVEELKNKCDELDIKLNNYTDELLQIYQELRSTESDIDDTIDNRVKIEII